MDDLRKHLEPGERLLWSGRPRQGIVFRAVDAILIPFSLLWIAIVAAFGWVMLSRGGLSNQSEDDLLPVILLSGAMLAAGLYSVVGRHITDYVRRSRTIYAVTDRRVLIDHRSWPRKLVSLDVQHLPNLRLDQSSNAQGTIEFYDTASFARGTRMGVWHPTIGQPPKLFEIEDAKRVFEIIRDASGKTTRDTTR